MQAAHVIGQEPAAITLRFLQTVSEIASEHNSTTFFPLPIDLLKPFLGAYRQSEPPGTPALASPVAQPTLANPAPGAALPAPAQREGAERRG